MNPLAVRMTILLLVLGLAALAFAPALDAGFHPEDFSYLALMRHLESPWPLLVDNVFFVYYYRATGMLFWWLSVQLAGTDAWWHNLFDLGLHALNAALVSALAMRLAREPVAGLVAGAAFACLPAAASTAMWMADRYDPLALFFGLLALLAFERAMEGSRRALAWTGLWLLLSITSKEVAYAIAGLMLLRLLWRAWEQRLWNPWLALVVVAPVGIALLMRVLTVQQLESALSLTDLAGGAVAGTLAWWQRLPAAMSGFTTPTAWATGLLAAVTTVSLLAIATGALARRDDVVKLAVTGAVLVLAPSILQWPVTSLVLPHEGAVTHLVNLRFFHLAVAGVALLLGAGWLALGHRTLRVLFGIALAALCVVWFGQTRDNARRWAHEQDARTPVYLALGRDLGALAFPPGCRIALDPAQLPPAIHPHIDTTVKAGVPRGAPILGCSVTAGRHAFVTLVDGGLCSPAHWPGMSTKTYGGKPGFQRVGALCAISFDRADDGTQPATRLRFDVDAQGRVTPVQTGSP